MTFRHLFINDTGTLRTLWRILVFICVLLLFISPLILIRNTYIQFFGAIVILIGCLHLNATYLDKNDFSEYGLSFKKRTFIHAIAGILIGAMAVLLMLSIGISTQILSIAKIESDLNLHPILLFALKMLLVGILEETLFRGYLFTSIYNGIPSKKITKRQAFWIAFIVSSICFGLAHLNTNNTSVFSIIVLAINGMVWCIPFVMTKNLGLSIGLHMAWNFTQTQIGFTMSGNVPVHALYRIENHGSDLLTGGAYGPEAGVLGLIGCIAMLLLSFAYIKVFQKMSCNRSIESLLYFW